MYLKKETQVATIESDKIAQDLMCQGFVEMTIDEILEHENFLEEQQQNENQQQKLFCEVTEIKQKLEKLSEDIIQNIVGEDVPSLETKKKDFFDLHNRLRILEGKTPRQLRII